MKQAGDYIIADPGKYLISGCYKGFKMPAGVNYNEIDIDTEKIKKIGTYVFVDNIVAVKIGSHAEMKTALVKSIYSNDDQIAIMLNGNQADMDLMQNWRTYISDLLHIIEDKYK